VLRKYVGPPTRFYIVGGPLYRTLAQHSVEELREDARKLGIADCVGFVPFQAHPEWIYRSLDLVVHASESPEPFGLTIAEAMACGRPVIVSRAGGAAELFIPDVEAIGVPPGNVAALCQAIVSVRANEEMRIRLGKAARVRAECDFQPARLAAQLAALYRSILPTATKSIRAQALLKAPAPANPTSADPK
jgi:glycosyltransferase involved in cell wall biosynthesis